MNNKLSAYLKTSSFVLLVIVILFVIVNFVTKSQITIVLADGTVATETVVRVDGEILPASGKDGLQYRAKVGYGSHLILVQGVDKEPTSQTISTSFLNNKTIEIMPLNDTSITEILSEAYDESGVEFINPRYFANKTWVVFFIAPEEERTEGSIGVARYESSSGWEVVEEGTDFDYSQGVFVDAPEDLVAYMRGL